MVNKSQEEACATLREIIKDDTLTHLPEVCKSADTVMDKHGKIRREDSLSTKGNLPVEVRIELGRKRKKLVLGLDGHETHSLREANAIIEAKIEEYEEVDGSSGIVSFIRKQFQ